MWTSGNFTMLDVVFLLLSYAVLIFVTMPVHEFAHAYSAYKLGDTTAKWNGRLSLNPLKHLDMFGTLMMVLFGFGYARPVPVNPNNFRNPKRGMALTALAGPVSNLLMAALALVLFRVVCLVIGVDMRDGGFYVNAQNETLFHYAFLILVNVFAGINLSLAVFNLLPIPPLDGSRLFEAVLPNRWVYAMERYQQYFLIGLMAAIFLGALDVPLALLRRGFGFVMCTLLGMPNVF
ncbi:MAG: site-2 protease family protein [Clostridia bacterium]|nr:site-2 protease family protein [Clostridia bacterium]